MAEAKHRRAPSGNVVIVGKLTMYGNDSPRVDVGYPKLYIVQLVLRKHGSKNERDPGRQR